MEEQEIMADIRACMTSKSQEWETPEWLFNELNNEFGFTLDPCATPENAKCRNYYTVSEDGLKKSWGGQRVFCNPPYNKVKHWIRKASEEARKPDTIVVMLIPAKTDTKAFHEYIYHKAEIRFLKGRLRFGNSKWNAPFASMVVIFRSGGLA